MEKSTFRKSEVIAYLEDKLLMNMATEDETKLYQDYKYNGKLKNGYARINLIKEMKEIYENGF